MLNPDEMNVMSVYKTIWSICKLPRQYIQQNRVSGTLSSGFSDIQTLLIIHFIAKIGFQANDAVTSLKFVEKGLGREDLAIAVLIDFPFQIFGGYLAARWSTPQRPLRPWILAYLPRLAFALISTLIVYYFPTPPISSAFFGLLVVETVLQGFAG